MRRFLIPWLCLAAWALPAPGVAGPFGQLSAAWFTLGFGHIDTGNAVQGPTPGLVQAVLGPDGLPVRSALSAGAPPGGSNLIQDVDGSGQILWWTPGLRSGIGTVAVDAAYPSLVDMPFNRPADLFPGAGTGNGNPVGYLTLHLSGSFDAPGSGSVNFLVGADDDAWIFINGVLAVDLGGVKPLSTVLVPVSGLAPGPHRIDLFFADRQATQSGLVFSADVAFRPSNATGPIAVPLPGAAAFLGVGLLGILLARRPGRAAGAAAR